MRKVRSLAPILLAWAATVSAQQSVDYASVSGRVTDPSGAVVAGAQVTARHTETNVTGMATTDGEGRFRFPYLKVGPHEITISDPNVAIINAHLARVGYLGPQISTGVFPIQQDLVNVLAKVDHEFGPKDRFSFRYSRYNLDAINSRNIGALNAPSAATGLDNMDQSFAVSNVALLSSRTVLESRAPRPSTSPTGATT